MWSGAYAPLFGLQKVIPTPSTKMGPFPPATPRLAPSLGDQKAHTFQLGPEPCFLFQLPDLGFMSPSSVYTSLSLTPSSFTPLAPSLFFPLLLPLPLPPPFTPVLALRAPIAVSSTSPLPHTLPTAPFPPAGLSLSLSARCTLWTLPPILLSISPPPLSPTHRTLLSLALPPLSPPRRPTCVILFYLSRESLFVQ